MKDVIRAIIGGIIGLLFGFFFLTQAIINLGVPNFYWWTVVPIVTAIIFGIIGYKYNSLKALWKS